MRANSPRPIGATMCSPTHSPHSPQPHCAFSHPCSTMRLRLVHTLSLTLLAFAGVAVLALGGLTAWNLRNGFGSYLAARDVQHLGRFAGVVEAAAAREGGLQALQQGRLDLRELLDELKPPGLLGPTHPPAGRPPAGPDRFGERVHPSSTVKRVSQ